MKTTTELKAEASATFKRSMESLEEAHNGPMGSSEETYNTGMKAVLRTLRATRRDIDKGEQ